MDYLPVPIESRITPAVLTVMAKRELGENNSDDATA